MEWREQSAVGSDEAYLEARRWIEAATEKAFGSEDFRAALENGVLLCDLINRIKPGTIRRVNRLPTPIAGLDNLNVFLKAGRKLGLKEAQLFHPGDLQDLSSRVTVKHQETNRRLKNVLITIFWLGRRAQCERGYDGPHLNLKAFEGLLGTALFKALQESSSQKGGSVRDSGFGDSWYSEREEVVQLRGGGGGGGRGGHRRDDSLDSLDSLGSRPRSISSDATLKGGSEGCCSDAEADAVLRMDDNRSGLSYRRSVTITPKASGPFNQFLPTKDKVSGYVPAPLRKKRAERHEDSRRSWVGPASGEDEGTLSSEATLSPDCYGDTRAPWGASPLPPPQWADEYGSGSDSDADRPDPDLVLDDLASRRFHSPSPAPPTNFAVPISPTAAAAGGRPSSGGGGAGGGPWPKVAHVTPQQNVTFLSGVETPPPQQGSVTVDHRRPVSSDSLFRETYGDSEDEDDDDVGYADPVQDDLYSRKMGIKPQPVTKQSYDKFLPKFWTPDEDVHVQKIKLGSQTRPWYKKMQGFRQRTESVDGSKSTSDILVERQDRYEELQRFREQTKETEDKWQDDLSKWKNRRRSVNSDIVKKKEERDHIEQITSGGGRRSKTFKEMQEERETKGRNSIGGRLGSLSYLDDEDVFNAPVVAPRTRTLPARSYTIDTPYSSSEPPEPVLKEADPPSAAASPAPPPAPRGSDTVNRPAGRDATTAIGLRSAAPAPPQRSPERTVKTEASSTATSLEKEPRPRLPLSRTQPEAEAPSSGFLHKQPPPPPQLQTGSMEARPPGVSRVSASLPRSYQRSDSARLTSVVAPRPFGAQSSRLTSLPRALTVDDPQKRVNGDADVSRKSAVPSRYHQFMTSEDEAHSQTSSARSTEDEEEEEEEVKTAVKTVSPVKPEAPVGPAPPKETSQENCREMRISLNQKPNSSKDFGFQAVWDSTGARVTSIQPGSPAEMCQLQVGDEVLTLNGQQVADMSYVDWKSSMEEALQEGSLIIDIRHRGNNSSHDNNAVGSSLDFTSRRSTAAKPPPPPVREAAARPLLDAASNGVNGGFREPPVTLRNKESEPISLKNLKRRSEFFEKGGSESVMPDIPVPPLTLTSSRWSWDPEEERKRQEKWQKEQERILQEKYKRDQEKLQEEWLKDQEEIARSTDPPEPVSLEVNRHIISPHSPRSPLNQPPWEEEEEEEERKREEEEEERQRKVEEERQRQEEVERQRQAEVERQRQAEERSRREEEKRELQRLQEERQRKERQEEEERKMVAEEELRWQKRREEEREAERRRQEAAEQQRRDQWMKSKSCSQLDEEEAPQRKGRGVAQWLLEGMARTAADREARRAAAELETERRNILNATRYRELERVTGGGGLAEKKGLQSGSHAELERQQILNEMKKKTPLLMDRSWIRQRSAATEPDAGGVKESDMPPIRRGESLDNLDSYNSWRSSWTPRTSSVSQVQNYTRPHSALSGAPRPGSSSTLPSSSSMGSLRGGAGTPSFPWSQQSSTSSLTDTSPEPTSEGPQQRGSASTVSPTSGDRKPAPKSGYETSSCTVTPATCDSKPASQPPCDVTVLQQIDEETTCDNNP